MKINHLLWPEKNKETSVFCAMGDIEIMRRCTFSAANQQEQIEIRHCSLVSLHFRCSHQHRHCTDHQQSQGLQLKLLPKHAGRDLLLPRDIELEHQGTMHRGDVDFLDSWVHIQLQN